MTNANSDKPSVKGILISITVLGLAFMAIGFLIGFVLGYDMGRLDGFKIGVEAAAEYMRSPVNPPQAPIEIVPEREI